MAMTLVEAKKLATNPTEIFVINEFLESRLLQILPFRNVQGGGYFYNTTEQLPGVGFRGINKDFSESTGVLNPQSEALKILGGDLKVDTALVDRHGEQTRIAHVRLKLQASRLSFEKTFFKGDSIALPEGFDGLQRRIGGNQLIQNGTDATGNPLSINSLDTAIDQVKAGTGRKYLFCNDQIKRRLEQYHRTSNSGQVRYQINELGEEITMYRGCEVVPIQDDEAGNEILGFTEVSPDGSSSTNNTSIYIARFGELLCGGIQGPSNGTNGIYAHDFGRIEASPHFLTRVQWDCGMVIENGRSVARLHGIQDAVAVD